MEGTTLLSYVQDKFDICKGGESYQHRVCLCCCCAHRIYIPGIKVAFTLHTSHAPASFLRLSFVSLHLRYPGIAHDVMRSATEKRAFSSCRQIANTKYTKYPKNKGGFATRRDRPIYI